MIKKVAVKAQKSTQLTYELWKKPLFEVGKQNVSCRCCIDLLAACLQRHNHIVIFLSWQIKKNRSMVNALSYVLLFFRMQRVFPQNKCLKNVAVKCNVSFNQRTSLMPPPLAFNKRSQSCVICCSSHSSHPGQKIFPFSILFPEHNGSPKAGQTYCFFFGLMEYLAFFS